jgi:hypothetical protein
VPSGFFAFSTEILRLSVRLMAPLGSGLRDPEMIGFKLQAFSGRIHAQKLSSTLSGGAQMQPRLSIIKRDTDRFAAAFETPEGRLTCEISVARQQGASDRRTAREKENEARKKLKSLAREFSQSISGDKPIDTNQT